MNGCIQASPSCTSRPLISFIGGGELDDSEHLCSDGPIGACGQLHRPISSSLRNAMEFPLTRTLYSVGLNRTDGYWTFSNIYGEILPQGYVDPVNSNRLLGGLIATSNTDEKGWLCICSN